MRIPATSLGIALWLICVGITEASAQDKTGTAGFLDAAATPPQANQEAREAADLDLEQLANTEVKVTSASKKSESLNQAPAAIYVITGEEIRRGGFSSVPEALRTVPGLYVAQEDAHSWIVAARGSVTHSMTRCWCCWMDGCYVNRFSAECIGTPLIRRSKI